MQEYDRTVMVETLTELLVELEAETCVLWRATYSTDISNYLDYSQGIEYMCRLCRRP